MSTDNDNTGESFQCHVCFSTTTAAEGPLPAPTVLREVRCHITRTVAGQGVLPSTATAGLYYLTALEDIGGATGESVDYEASAEAAVAAGAIINIKKLAPFIWQVQLFTVVDTPPAVLTLSDLVSGGNVAAIVNITLRRVDPA